MAPLHHTAALGAGDAAPSRSVVLVLDRGLWADGRLHAPDDLGVLGDGAVRGELRHGGGRLNAQTRPLGLVSIRLVDAILGFEVRGEVVDEEVAVAIPGARPCNVAQLVDQAAELLVSLVVTKGELALPDRVEDALHLWVDGVVAGLGRLLDDGHVRLEAAENEHGVITALLSDLDVRAIHGADDEASVHDKLHVRGATGLGASGGNVLRDVRGGDDVLGDAHAVVRHEGDLEVRRNIGVVVDHLRQVPDKLDDSLCIDIRRRSLSSEEGCPLLELGTVTRRRLLDHQVPVDDVEAVQELTLVLVDALELAVEQRIHICVKDVLLLQKVDQFLLGLLLRGHPFPLQCGVVLLLNHLLQQLHVGQPLLRTKVLGENVTEWPVRAMNPSAGRHAVGHVHKLLLLALVAKVLVEVSKSLLLHDLSVERSHTVDLVAAQDRKVSHADALEGLLLEKAEAPNPGVIAVHLGQLLNEAFVDLADNLQVARQILLHHLHRPLLQRLRHHCVVGVVASLLGELPSLAPWNLLHINKQAHHLHNSHGGVCIVHLHSNLVRQFGPLPAWLLQEITEQVLKRCADKEVLLLQAQDLPSSLIIVGVENRGEVLGFPAVVNGISIAEVVEGCEIKLLAGKSPPQPKVVGVECVKARDGVVVSHGLDDLSTDPPLTPAALLIAVIFNAATEADRVRHVRPRDLPRHRLGEPVVWLLDLPSVNDVLLENAVFVADAVAPAWKRERGHRVQEASRQSAETTVAKARVSLEGVELLHLEP
mmetsp:Transcript_31107/g.61073  ORF Transcript_31107/g.61073 Transcript_31107/m.61073 type:complete len:763 (+) Transcript_31107:282-2570(+)